MKLHIDFTDTCFSCEATFLRFVFMCMDTLPADVSVQHACACCVWNSEGGVGSPGTGVSGGCQPPCGDWELNAGPQGEQPVLLTIEPPLQPHLNILNLDLKPYFSINKKFWKKSKSFETFLEKDNQVNISGKGGHFKPLLAQGNG